MNKIKNNSGIALMTLTLAVLILVIISSMLVYYSTDAVNVQKLSKMHNDIEQLEEKLQNYYLDKEELPVLTEYLNTSNIKENETDKFFVIDLSKLKNLNLNYGRDFEKIKSEYNKSGFNDSKYTDIYVINQRNMRVYYIDGIKMSGNTYYTKDKENQDIEVKVTRINSIEDLLRLSLDVNSGNSYENEYIVLERNLDFKDENSYDKTEVEINGVKYVYGGVTNNLQTYLTDPSGRGFPLIGAPSTPFKGTFNGKGFIISNIHTAGNVKTIFAYAIGKKIDVTVM